MLKKISSYLSLIKFSHSIFALPFALIGVTLGLLNFNEATSIQQNIWIKNATSFSTQVIIEKIVLVLLAMIFARSAAMAFNRYLDRKIDAKNPRTAIREIPSGIIGEKNALIFTVISCLGFVMVCFFINELCFYLSFVALAVVLGYSFTKRFTPLCHLILGLGLSLAPIGAYLAVVAQFQLLPILFSIVVLFWVSGFDIIYALQDEVFDRQTGLKSIPVLLGKNGALQLSRIFHFLAALVLVFIALRYPFGVLYYFATMVFIVLLVKQHLLVKPNDLSKVNLAFFTLNGIASLVFAFLVILDFFIVKRN